MTHAQTMTTTRQRAEDRILIYGLILSLILHIVTIPLLLNPAPRTGIPVPPQIDISFEPAQRPQQIVSPPDAPESENAPLTDKVAEKNFETEREMIKRGLPSADTPAKLTTANETFKQQKERSASPATHPAPHRAAPTEDQPREPAKQNRNELIPLNLSREALMDTFGAGARTKSTDRPNDQHKTTTNNEFAADLSAKPQPFSRAAGAGAAFFGSGGTPDYLPSLPDGDMTMLNAKASKYATFVRRVAVQVFAALRTQGWESLSGYDLNSAGSATLARAVLNKKGDLVAVRIVTRSGSSPFDEVLISSIRTGAKDPNPPPDALADDGTYRFLFEARSWAIRSTDPRTGAPSERRWLMLGTGLE